MTRMGDMRASEQHQSSIVMYARQDNTNKILYLYIPKRGKQNHLKKYIFIKRYLVIQVDLRNGRNDT